MIPEQIIEKTIAKFDNDREAYESAMTEMMDGQPALVAFLSQESNDVLTEEEKDILWYISLILISSTRADNYQVGEIAHESLADNDEANWEILHDQPKGNFRDRVTVFFEGYEQEDLLAFVEDTVELEDDGPITTVGREVIFMSAKCVIDSIFVNEN